MKITALLTIALLNLAPLCTAATLLEDDLWVYYDYTTTTGTGNGTRLTPVVNKANSTYNPVTDFNKLSTTGGYMGGGYTMSSGTSYYTPSCESLGGAGITNKSGFSISFHFKDIGTAGISLSTWFGSNNDATFILTGNSLDCPSGNNFNSSWVMADGRNSVISNTGASYNNPAAADSAPWQSFILSVGTDGLMQIFLDGTLFAHSTKTWDRMDNANLGSVRLGGNGTNNSGKTDAQYSDFAIWNKALSADEAKLLSSTSVAGAIAVPEPATATLGILGLAGLLLRRRTRK